MVQSPAWGWEVWLYFFLGGIAGGSFFTATLIDLFGDRTDRPIAKIGYFLSFGAVIVCALLLIIDLGQPLRFWHLMVSQNALKAGAPLPQLNPNSAISWGAWGLLGFGFFNLLAVLDVLVEDGRLTLAPLRAFYSAVPRKIYAALGSVFGFFLAAYTGVLLNTTAQPIWGDNTLFGALFLASAGSAGVAAIALIAALRKMELGDGWLKISRTLFLFLSIELILVALELVGGTALGAGPWAIPFWGFVLVGLVVPLVMQLRAGVGGQPLPRNLVILASLLVLLGALTMRYVVVMSAQT